MECPWSSHDRLSVVGASTEEIRASVISALDVAAYGRSPSDGWAVGDRVYAEITYDDESTETVSVVLTSAHIGRKPAKLLRDEALAIVGSIRFHLFAHIVVLRHPGTKSGSWRVLYRSNLFGVTRTEKIDHALTIARSVFDKEVAGLRRGSVAIVEFPVVGPAHVRLECRSGGRKPRRVPQGGGE